MRIEGEPVDEIDIANSQPLLRAFKKLSSELLKIINNMKKGQKNKLALKL